MNRPSWFPVPEFLLNIVLGELASMLTKGQRVLPGKAIERGFSFKYPTLPHALQALFHSQLTLKE
ncbi:DUF1731 domain-containing protein [candidate division KSB1 bacterium]|nr:DUF1731 domain-containing protein [Candidatus Bathyarchaeota archaeon]NIV95763.1 DUF1731 domain-containing protein [candidate division KSB1 bacterium]